MYDTDGFYKDINPIQQISLSIRHILLTAWFFILNIRVCRSPELNS